MSIEVGILAYRPREENEGELEERLRAYAGVLRAEGMVTDRPPTLLLSPLDDTLLLLVEWRSPQEERRAQDAPAVNAALARIEEIGELIALGDLEEADTPGATFEVVPVRG